MPPSLLCTFNGTFYQNGHLAGFNWKSRQLAGKKVVPPRLLTVSEA